MKKLLTVILASIVMMPVVMAEDAPPTLQLTIGAQPPQVEAELPAQEENQAPPQLELGVENNGNPQAVPAGGNNNNQQGNGGGSNESQAQEIKILSHSIFPKTLNPLTADATLTYKIQGNARVDVKIYNSRDQLVQTLVANKLHASGEYQIKWYGTVNGEQAGTPLPVGNYSYRIQAKNPADSSLEDSANGSMSIRYSVPSATSPAALDPIQTLNNNPPRQTSSTGPGILLYSLFPIMGYTLTRKK